MKWKDVLLLVLLIGAMVAVPMAIQANKQIKRGEFVADSIADAAGERHDSVARESKARADSIQFWKDSASRAGKAAGKIDTLVGGVRVQIQHDTTAADSLRHYKVLADTLYPKQIFALRVQHVADSNRISLLEVDRDSWMHDADSLSKDLDRLRKNTHVVANAARRRVNLGILTLPVDVIIGAGSAIVGVGVGYAVGSAGH